MEINNRKAVVVFSNQNAIPWLGFLSKGFRHCFIVVETGAGWAVIDPLSNIMKVDNLSDLPAHDLVDWYRSRGYRVLVATVLAPKMQVAPWALFTCVEVVKRILGIQARWVLTPKQLWNFLLNENNP